MSESYRLSGPTALANTSGQPVAYENKNQVDPKPLAVFGVSGRVTSEVGPAAKIHQTGVVPEARLGLFTELDHYLVATDVADERGDFQFTPVAPGLYRLVVHAAGLCVANVPLRVLSGHPSTAQDQIVVHLRPADVDSCSYAELVSANNRPVADRTPPGTRKKISFTNLTSLRMSTRTGTSASVRSDSKCSMATASAQTSWGHQNVIIQEETPVESLRGTVIVPALGTPLEGVLVEVYNNPEGLLLDWEQREAMKSQQLRVAACITGPDGAFDFIHVPPGTYELRSSKRDEWDPTSIYVVVAPHDAKSNRSPMVVPLQPSH